jgi:hypothetical protein
MNGAGIALIKNTLPMIGRVFFYHFSVSEPYKATNLQSPITA